MFLQKRRRNGKLVMHTLWKADISICIGLRTLVVVLVVSEFQAIIAKFQALEH